MKTKYIICQLIIILGILGCATPKQKMLYDSWIQIKVEKKDGSRFVERSGMNRFFTDLRISNTYLYESHKGIPNAVVPYTLVGDSIIKTNVDFYKVQSVNDTVLVLLENDDGRPDDKVNKLVFVKKKHCISYILNNNLVDYENDSTIILSKFFLQLYNGSWLNAFNDLIFTSNYNGYVSLEVILDSIGNTYRIQLIGSKNIPEKNANNIIKYISENNAWDLGVLNRSVYYKLNLVAQLSSESVGIKLFELNPDDNIYKNKTNQLNFSDINLSNKYFSEGIDYAEKNKLDSAIWSFSNCITIDSLYLDAYYNRAYIHNYLKQSDKSCDDWYFLYKQLGQKPAERFFNENCRKE